MRSFSCFICLLWLYPFPLPYPHTLYTNLPLLHHCWLLSFISIGTRLHSPYSSFPRWLAIFPSRTTLLRSSDTNSEQRTRYDACETIRVTRQMRTENTRE
ncbi:hypothetical protein CC78DRAFT_229037 [Lojkania enalia]|uniref:Uncharacterized protein n=1 Tax=Lojkania enalia TaxID=147567 RepID=A0A9P4KA46_9PLEO|nr:hypothetical protein CC78DRAFT_229037 [Didymosphaeria enalia]